MKHIVKGPPPAAFEEWKALADGDWIPTYDGLQKPQKAELHVALLSEQAWVCCYCGQEISNTDSHVEHFRPQNQRDDLALSYENLYASCIRETKPGMPLHCGHAKADNFDEECHISPLDPACEERFLYTLRGEILPTDLADERAAYMVGLLQLDIPFLRNRREDALQRTFDADFLASVTANELRVLRDALRRHDSSGRAQSFGHVLARYADQCLAAGWADDLIAAQTVTPSDKEEAAAVESDSAGAFSCPSE